MPSINFDHAIVKGMLVSLGALAVKWSRKYSSFAIITAALYSLERALAREEDIEKQLEIYERAGYNLRDFRSLLSYRKAEDLTYEYNKLKKDIETAERLKSQLYRSNIPHANRIKMEQTLKLNPASAQEISRSLMTRV